MKRNISKITSCTVGNKRFSRKIWFLIWEAKKNKKNASLQDKPLGTKDEKRSQKKRTRLKLKAPIDEAIGRSLGN